MFIRVENKAYYYATRHIIFIFSLRGNISNKYIMLSRRQKGSGTFQWQAALLEVYISYPDPDVNNFIVLSIGVVYGFIPRSSTNYWLKLFFDSVISPQVPNPFQGTFEAINYDIGAAISEQLEVEKSDKIVIKSIEPISVSPQMEKAVSTLNSLGFRSRYLLPYYSWLYS